MRNGYVWFLGRRDDLINTFGYRVSPHEIDRVLRDHPDVADCAATAEEVGPDRAVSMLAGCNALACTGRIPHSRPLLKELETDEVTPLLPHSTSSRRLSSSTRR